MNKVTAENLTDEHHSEPFTVETVTCKEIREEQHRASLAGDRDWMRTCHRALTLGGGAERQAVAAAINARREAERSK